MIAAFTRMGWVAALRTQAAAPETSFRRNADQADCGGRSTRHAHAVWPASSSFISLVAAARRRRGLSRRPLERRVSRRLAPGRVVRSTLIGFDLAAGDCALQSALGAAPPAGRGIG